MSEEEYDAFGRRIGEPPDLPPTESIRHEASPHTTTTAAAPPASAPGRRGAVLFVLLLLAAGAGGILFSLQIAVDRAADQPRTLTFALRNDPLHARSLLRTQPLRDAIARAVREIRSDERVADLTATPNLLRVTVIDREDQARWIRIDAAGQIQTTDLGTAEARTTVSSGAVAKADPAPATRLMARRFRQLSPKARDPQISMAFYVEKRTVAGWTLILDGVRSAERRRTISTTGKTIR